MTRNGEMAVATVVSAQRTGSRSGFKARVELCFSYIALGQQFEGRVVRDFAASAAADSLAYDNHPSDKIEIRFAQENPAISYYPSGLGFFWPIAEGAVRLLFCAAFVAGIVHMLLPHP